MVYLAAFIFGSIFGSFCNVCIYRLPLSKSIAKERSFCPTEKAWRINLDITGDVKYRKITAIVPGDDPLFEELLYLKSQKDLLGFL